MTKILIVIGGFMSEGGSERSLINLLNILTPDKCKVDLLVFSERGYHYKIVPNYINKLPLLWELDFYSKELIEKYKEAEKWELIRAREELHKTGEDKRDLAFCWDKIKDLLPIYKGYDIAISYNMGTPMRYVVDKVIARKKIAWVHFDYNSTFTPPAQSAEMICEYVNGLDTIVCVTEQNKDSLSNKCPKAKDKIKVIPNINDVKKMLLQSEEGYPKEFEEKKVNIFTASRITFDKGIDTLIHAAKLLKDKGTDFLWIVAGQKSPGYEKYEKWILNENLQENIKLVGFVKNPFPYYKFCDLYVQPSPYEGKSVAVEEAKILGCAIIITNYPSAKDSIQNHVNGIICGRTAESLANSIDSLINNPLECKKLKKALSGYKYDNALEKYAELLEF